MISYIFILLLPRGNMHFAKGSQLEYPQSVVKYYKCKRHFIIFDKVLSLLNSLYQSNKRYKLHLICGVTDKLIAEWQHTCSLASK